MKALNLLQLLVNQELQGQLLQGRSLLLKKVDIPTSQGDNWLWFFCFFDGTNDTNDLEEIFKKSLEVISPFSRSEVLGHSCSGDVLTAFEDCLPRYLSLTDLLAETSNLKMPSYAKEILRVMSNKEQILFFRLKREGISDASTLVKELRQRTWFQARFMPFQSLNRNIEFSLGASRDRLTIENEKGIVYFDTNTSFCGIFESLRGESKISIKVFDPLKMNTNFLVSLNDFLRVIGFSINRAYGFEFRIPIEIEVFLRESFEFTPQIFLEELQSSDIACRACRDLVARQIEEQKRETVERLERRRQNLLSRQKISIQDGYETIDLGYVPTNETELIILASKMEPLIKKHFGEFQLLEHTSQLGIDGIINIRRTTASAVEKLVNVEFEYTLENFFKHEHPIEQTQYIICWDLDRIQRGSSQLKIGKKGFYQDTSIEVSLHSDGWIRVLSFKNHMIYILPLIYFPGLVLS